MERDLSTRWINPAVKNEEIWPGPGGYPWANTGARLWTREGLLRRTGKNNLVATWTTGGFSEPADGNFTMIATSDDNGKSWSDAGRFQHARHTGDPPGACVCAGADSPASLAGAWASRLWSRGRRRAAPADRRG